MGSELFEVRRRYERSKVAELIGLSEDQRSGGAWMTGYSRWGDAIYVFCNIGVAGRTGHDYPNRWNGKQLVWYGKTGSELEQPMIVAMLSGRTPVHIFWRASDRAPFTYAGLGRAVEAREGPPVEIIWALEETSEPPRFEPQSPRWRRGPPPTPGSRSAQFEDGPTSVYVMSLAPDPRALFPDLSPDLRVIKVGMSNDPDRRLDEMNVGFPHGSRIRWALLFTHRFPTGRTAYLGEGRALECLRTTDRWIGGEFGRIEESALPDLFEKVPEPKRREPTEDRKDRSVSPTTLPSPPATPRRRAQ